MALFNHGQHRLYNRIDARVPVSRSDFGTVDREWATNIGRGGLFLNTLRLVEPETRLELFLPITWDAGEMDEIAVLGEVVHIQQKQHYGLGIHFVVVEPKQQEDFHRFLENLLLGPPVSSLDMRLAHRLFADLSATLVRQDRAVTVYITNLSRYGACLVSAEPLKLGEALTLELIHPAQKTQLTLHSQVVRIMPRRPFPTKRLASNMESYRYLGAITFTGRSSAGYHRLLRHLSHATHGMLDSLSQA